MRTRSGPRDLAPWGQRAGAALLDLFFLATLGAVIWLVYFADYPWENRPLEVAAGAWWFGVLWLFTAVGWTPGMRAVEMTIVAADGEAPGPWRGLLRALGAFCSAAPLGLGYLWAAWDREHRTWHDHLAGTWVVIDYRHQFNDTPIPDLDELRDRRLGLGRMRDL